MAIMRLSLRFTKKLVPKPIIYQLGHDFKVVTNIRKANIDEDLGWMVLELDGEMDEIDRAVEDLAKQGIKVDPIEGDIVEG
ncbi:FeS-binding protein [Candidatus Desantisbacteria bacterium CG2_30_40_21]|uniref:FeS-binding protein n=6 Tax=unclassified Candidatus Desantisiibacteriota TaxID=3106372 RepID=A0A2M7J914_9BACT|nr:MAG: FeS-binding protein [Candidatus Desantisbacteria bacterium CG2_30_40_21]PIX15889.1 MAG: FeS-binding protein [Candidatus Desantisbacteria bacterium CG_4_8_14_3_um_filter_40_12]PJB28285.1 MAG: FeS-binding protein [Candidatus Desantisbacteria bacterium CG_4_9_14_3_um_filter_40_11]